MRDDGKVLVSFTKDLMEFDGEIFPDLHAEGKVVNPRCSYNGSEYVITWEDGQGSLFESVTADFTEFSQPVSISARENSQLDTDLENALPCSVIPVTKEEAENLRVKLGSLENTGVEEKNICLYRGTRGTP